MFTFKQIQDLLSQLSTAGEKVVLTIGSFDGLHLGHVAILQKMHDFSKHHVAKTAVLTFKPSQVQEFKNSSFPIQTAEQKINTFSQTKLVDYLVTQEFTTKFAQQEPQEFLDRFITPKTIVALFVGDDFRFGRNRTGDYQLLKKHCLEHGIYLEQLPTFTINDLVTENELMKLQEKLPQVINETRVSSTLIRNLISNNLFATANYFLASSYSVSGTVLHGKKLGRQFGFPTANIQLPLDQTPLHGVYLCLVKVEGEEGLRQAISNFGFRPTLHKDRTILSGEVHIVNAEKNFNLYDKKITVYPLTKYRSEQKFESVDQLRIQISIDVAFALAYFYDNKVADNCAKFNIKV